MIASKQMWWQILHKFISMKIYTSKRASVLEISSLAQPLSYLAKKMRPNTTSLKTKSLNLLKRSDL